MHLEFLVEERSAEAALEILVPRIAGPDTSFRIHPYLGKTHLVGELPRVLRGYRRILQDDGRLVVLMDRDGADCVRLRRELDAIGRSAGMPLRAGPGRGGQGTVAFRLAIWELEAWFFGDMDAVRSAYPGVPAGLERKARYRDPDAITVPWKALEKELQRAGYHGGGLAKISAARAIAGHMDPTVNRSRSFLKFCEAVRG